jgi:hypothetical protein
MRQHSFAAPLLLVLLAVPCIADSYKQMQKDTNQQLSDMYKEHKDSEAAMRKASQELNNEQDKGWHQYLKEQNKPDKAWNKATKQEQKSFKKWWSQRGKQS